MNNSKKHPTNFADLINYTEFLENRINRLEEVLKLKPLKMPETVSGKTKQGDKKNEKHEGLEFQIGQFWFAKIGVILLTLGIAFILSLPYNELPAYLPGLTGYFITAAVAVLAFFLKKSFQFISQYLTGSALLLLYFSTLRFYYFSENIVLFNKDILVLFLMSVVLFNLFFALKRKSVYLFAVNITLGYLTAIISDSAVSIFVINSLLTIGIVYAKLKFHWRKIIFYGLFLTYFTHFAWFIGNPLMGHNFEFIKGSEFNLAFILFYMVVYALGNFLRPKNEPEDENLIISTILNCGFGYGLFLIIFFVGSIQFLPIYHILGALLFLASSSAFWIKEKSKYSSFFYSILGFTALSVAIILGFDNPDFFILLCWQSLLVVALALLYRSKIIVIANFFMFLLIFLSFLFSANEVGSISFSFGVVALLTARILGWQQRRLEIKTELLRNTYLLVAFVIFPYTLYRVIPEGYISLSWIGLALMFYIISIILKNIKYRWMALYTLLLTTLYLVLIGITQPDPTIKILSFISLGVVLLIISFIYSRSRPKQESKDKK